MKIMKKISALLLVLVMVFVAAGCSKDTGSSTNSSGSKVAKDIKDIKIGVSVGTLKQERWQREIDMFKTYAKDKGFQVLVQSAEDDAQKQVSQCENLINQGIDVLVIQSINADAAAPIVNAAHEAKIPVVSYDRFIMNADLDYYITFDSVKVGEVEAKFVVEKAPKGNYIWLKGGPEDNNAHLVAQGQRNVLQPYIDKGDIKIILEQWCKGWDPNEALKHVENGLTAAQNNVQGIIASNDGTAGGAIQAMAAQGLAGKVPIAGQDADLAACQRIVEGIQTGTVYKPIAKLNQVAMDVAVALATGKDAKTAVDSKLGQWTKLNNKTKDVDSFSVDVIAIDKNNIDEILIKQDKFQKVEEVYKNVPKDKWPSI
ncbi:MULTISPECIES: sugar ABC transporter substrate-binding protein [Pelosinus]|uniref:D-xylose ABC transporter periplasmic substrate-binding protein n=1 Tax=Pelosinus fermentans B4 TaxID=1149862 RepID=I8RGS8_9FIRM|nr:D-xylose ABC transporter periplasmic substrate-binding protein [Pelosinus fermentans B4]EIW21942.1 D-xylose ABC transporter periplasmic substrate-binding protein [Pelosinus fermentans A11]OAM95207.1 Periplasmic binding protein domain containing protein [Pelosinus fermentans DSM 17108]SDR24765.1 D-xylose transport system substrate-binding protein [Pelosinus fermentans]